MKDYISLGSTPFDENCAQLGTPSYATLAAKETRAYKNQLNRIVRSFGYEELPETFKIVSKAFPHDFGTYHEVCAVFDNNDEEALELAYRLESNLPEKWDSVALRELSE